MRKLAGSTTKSTRTTTLSHRQPERYFANRSSTQHVSYPPILLFHSSLPTTDTCLARLLKLALGEGKKMIRRLTNFVRGVCLQCLRPAERGQQAAACCSDAGTTRAPEGCVHCHTACALVGSGNISAHTHTHDSCDSFTITRRGDYSLKPQDGPTEAEDELVRILEPTTRGASCRLSQQQAAGAPAGEGIQLSSVIGIGNYGTVWKGHYNSKREVRVRVCDTRCCHSPNTHPITTRAAAHPPLPPGVPSCNLLSPLHSGPPPPSTQVAIKVTRLSKEQLLCDRQGVKAAAETESVICDLLCEVHHPNVVRTLACQQLVTEEGCWEQHLVQVGAGLNRQRRAARVTDALGFTHREVHDAPM